MTTKIVSKPGEFKNETTVPLPGEDIKAQHVRVPVQDLLDNDGLLYRSLAELRRELAQLRGQLRSLRVYLTAPSLSLEPNTTYALADFVRVERMGGITEDVQLSVLNLPAGVSAVFEPPVLKASADRAKLTLTTGGNLVAGTYSLVVRAEAGGVSDEAVLRAEVSASTAPRGFALSAPAALAIDRTKGNVTVFAVDITRSGGFADDISIQGVNLPAGVRVDVAPNPVTGSAAQQFRAATVTITADSAVPTGSYNLRLQASGGGIVRTHTASLAINTGAALEGLPDFQLSSVADGRGGVDVRITRSGGFTGPVVFYWLPTTDSNRWRDPDIIANGQVIGTQFMDANAGQMADLKGAVITSDTAKLTADGAAYGWRDSRILPYRVETTESNLVYVYAYAPGLPGDGYGQTYRTRFVLLGLERGTRMY